MLGTLANVHVASTGTDVEKLGRQSTLIYDATDLRGAGGDACCDGCPWSDGKEHSHFVVETGPGFLGVLERLGTEEAATGVRTYHFRGTPPTKKRGTQRPNFRSVAEETLLWDVYLPAILGNINPAIRLTLEQRVLLQVLLREVVRVRPDGEEPDGGPDDKAEVFVGNIVPDFATKSVVRCPLLDPAGRYVQFNGNGVHR